LVNSRSSLFITSCKIIAQTSLFRKYRVNLPNSFTKINPNAFIEETKRTGVGFSTTIKKVGISGKELSLKIAQVNGLTTQADHYF